jgi:hypothetical protein
VGRSFEHEGERIQIRDVRLSGIGGGRVALGVTLAGRVRGQLYFTGTPRLDPVRHEISVPDLELDVGTAQVLVRGYAWLRGVDLRDFLRERARLPESQAVARLRGLAESAIDRTLAPGVTLSARIHDLRAASVRTTSREIRLRAVADAEFRLAIDRAPALARLARGGGRRHSGERLVAGLGAWPAPDRRIPAPTRTKGSPTIAGFPRQYSRGVRVHTPRVPPEPEAGAAPATTRGNIQDLNDTQKPVTRLQRRPL